MIPTRKQFSRLMLGTVQFGTSYGIANTAGQVPYQTVRDILSCAWEGGVNCLDTAAGYGESEAVLGRALKELDLADHMALVTKVAWQPAGLGREEARQHVHQSVSRSRQLLGVESLPLCLFHREQDWEQIEHLEELKVMGQVQEAGVSVTFPQDTLEILKTGRAGAVQVPASILDHRFADCGIGQAAARAGCSVFVRSIYLQGLLFLPEEAVPPQLWPALPVRQRLATLAAEAGLSLQELAVRYILSLPWVNCVVVGVQSVAQMEENLRWFGQAPLEPALLQAVEEAVPLLPEAVLRPDLWPARRGQGA